jgi:hypothetical protein
MSVQIGNTMNQNIVEMRVFTLSKANEKLSSPDRKDWDFLGVFQNVEGVQVLMGRKTHAELLDPMFRKPM